MGHNRVIIDKVNNVLHGGAVVVSWRKLWIFWGWLRDFAVIPVHRRAMYQLLNQIAKFGIVGAVCFVIDYLVGLGILNLLMSFVTREYFSIVSVVASAVGFVVSVTVNYILSFKYVFERKENLGRKTEFLAFVILSVIGLLINSFIIWIIVGPVYGASSFLQANAGYNLLYTGAKISATVIVMVYNFVTRKIFLEKR